MLENRNKLVERAIGGLHESLMQALPPIGRDVAVLDIGCGTGAWLERLAQHGFTNLYGIDLDISQFGTDKAQCTQANLDFDDLNFGNRKFGLISAIEAIEHLENSGRLLDLVSNYLDENGYFLMTTPNIHSVGCRLRFLLTGNLKQFDAIGDPTHIYPVLLPALERMLSRHHLQITQQWPYPTDGSSITSRKLLKIGAAILSLLIPNDLPGDLLCFLIQRKHLLTENGRELR